MEKIIKSGNVTYTRIESVKELRNEVKNKHHNFFIHLGYARSSKKIYLEKDKSSFRVHNLIDNTKQVLSAEQIMDRNMTNIGYAISNGAFWMTT